jgi:hypothetical protein
VRHRVTPERLTWRYLRRRSFFEGVSKAALSKSLGSPDALSRERSYVWRDLPSGVWRELSNGRPAAAFAIVFSLASAGFGYVYGIVHTCAGGRFASVKERSAVR